MLLHGAGGGLAGRGKVGEEAVNGWEWGGSSLCKERMLSCRDSCIIIDMNALLIATSVFEVDRKTVERRSLERIPSRSDGGDERLACSTQSEKTHAPLSGKTR